MIETIWLIFYELPLVRMPDLCPDIRYIEVDFLSLANVYIRPESYIRT